MPEKPQEKKSAKKKIEKTGDKKPKECDEFARSGEQNQRSYYYDDACGYEIYQPDEDDEES